MSDKDKLIELLKTHDWSYAYSDDHRYYKAGELEEREILALIQKLGEEGKRLYHEYKPKLKESKPLDDKTVEKSDSIMKDLKTNKRDFVKKYGKDAEKVMKGRSINMAKKRVAENRIKDTIKEVLNEIGSDDKVMETDEMTIDEFINFLSRNQKEKPIFKYLILIVNVWSEVWNGETPTDLTKSSSRKLR